MSKLLAQTPFGGLEKTFDGIKLKEISGFEIVSLAVAKGQSNAFAKTFRKQFGGNLPEPGNWTTTKTGKILWTGQSQYFLFSDEVDERLDKTLQAPFSDIAYLTLQTDGWAPLEISGPKTHDVLERFIPLDLRAWEIRQGTRTSAHHIGVIVIKTGAETYQLLAPTSSSKTFLEALDHIIENVLSV